MNPFESLLEPLSPEHPCGEDISYDQDFLELDPLVAGKEETQFSEAVKPDWKLVQRRCLELFQKSKHLQVATTLCLSSLQTGGLPSAADALELLAKLTRRYWSDVFPQLDPSDGNDPLERLNILSALTTPVGSFGDNIRFIERLCEAPLTDSAVIGKLSYAQIRPDATSPTSGEAVETAQVDAAFRDTPVEVLQGTLAAIRQAQNAVRELVEFLNTLPEPDKVPSFDLLVAQLAELEKTVLPYLPEETEPEEETDPATGGEAGPTASAAPRSVPGEVRSRADVVAAIDRICRYYREKEPSSPVPLLLERAKRLVHADFLDIMTDLAPDAVTQIRNTAGIRDEASG